MNFSLKPQVYEAPGRCTECLSVRPLSDCTFRNVFRCVFCSYGTVSELLHVVPLQDGKL